MLHFLSLLSLWDWLDVVGVLLVLAGVIGEIKVPRMKFKTPPPKTEDEGEDSPMFARWVTEKEAWQARMNKWEHRWENALIIGLAFELLALPFHMKESADLHDRASKLERANLELEAVVQPRRITEEQQAIITRVLKTNLGTNKAEIALEVDSNDIEERLFAIRLNDALADFANIHWFVASMMPIGNARPEVHFGLEFTYEEPVRQEPWAVLLIIKRRMS